MISCEQFLSLLDIYPDGTLPPEQIREMEEHLAHCSQCATLMQMKKDLHALRAETEHMPVPENLSQAWHARIQKENRRVISLKHALPGILTAAAALAFTVIGTFRNRNIPAAESAPMVMTARLGPAPVPTFWEKVTAYLGDIGAFLLEYWPVYVCIAVFGLLLPKMFRKKCLCKRKKG